MDDNKEYGHDEAKEYLSEHINSGCFDDDELIDYLLEWINILVFDKDDLDLLVELHDNNNIIYSNCKMCSNDGFEAVPDNWNSFQGAWIDCNFTTHDVNIDGHYVSLCPDCYNDLKRLFE